MTNALTMQEDGNHYKVMKIQPIELAYRLNGSPCFCKLAKYLTRDKGDKLTNLRKAKHCIQLEQELLELGFGEEYVFNYHSAQYANAQIEQFTDVPLYQTALKEMYSGFTENAIAAVEQCIRMVEAGESL
jgi:hypothetical protein